MFDFKPQPFSLSFRARLVDSFTHDLHEVMLLEAWPHHAAFQLRQIEHRRKRVEQANTAGADEADEVGVFARQLADEDVGESDDRR